MDRIDLHIHSVYSDGTLTPGELINRAKAKNLRAISITDHDTVDGLTEGENAATAANIEFIPGCEISAYHNDLQIHILGYHINPRSKTLATQFSKLAIIRDERNQHMLQALSRVGIDVSNEQLEQAASGEIITRSHFAKVLWHSGHANSIRDAFDRYVAPGGAAFVPHTAMTVRECIEFIRCEGGVPVLAHPFLYHLHEPQVESLVQTLAGYGLMGIEAIYSSHTTYQINQATRWANKYRLVVTGGSDFHGENRPSSDIGTGRGSLFVPYSIINNLQDARDSLRTCIQ
ncbi:MAG: PHP domain-containing protein [Defluviitaleaceae bacterium]|nr:PHP domain-containing protein [Defluviitaleaceae bacterium]